MKHKTLTNWLLIDSILIFAAGFYMTFFKDSSWFVFKPLIDPYFWNEGVVADTGTQVFRSFMYTLLGVMMMVWGLIIYFMVKNAVAKNEKWAIDALLSSVLFWFPIDEFFSVYYGVWVNAIGNIIIFLILVIPLAILRIQIRRLNSRKE